MFICDKEFLRSLDFSSEEQRLATIGKLLWVPENTTNRVKVLVLADLHLQGGANECFGDRLDSARKWFGWKPDDTNWDALVVAGDLVAGDSIGWSKAKEAVGFSECHAKLEMIHTNAGEQINKSVRASQALAVPGNHDVVRMGGDGQRRVQMKQMLEQKGPHQASAFVRSVQMPLSGGKTLDADILSTTPRLLLVGGSLGVVAILGMDSNHLAYKAPGLEYPGYIGGDQLGNVKELADRLKKVFKDRPLFLWAVWHHHLLPVYNTEQTNRLISGAQKEDPSPTQLLSIFDAITIDGRTVVEHCCEWRISLATHGHMHAPCIQRVSYSPHTDQVLNMLACPSCLSKPDPEHPYVGATLVEIDLERGRAEISINGYQRIPDGGLGHEDKEMHRTFPIPLVSASRVTIGEMRLYRRLNAWLAKRDSEEGLLGTFPKDLPLPVPTRTPSAWEGSITGCLSDTGYVPVCMGSPQEVLRNGLLTREQIAVLPKKKYRLLLILDEHTPGSYDVLLNNYFPLRTSDYESWGAPLLPAFHNLNSLVAGWLVDVRARLDDYRELVRKGECVADEVGRLEGILSHLMRMRESDEELITISTRQFLKFSPMDGLPTLYEYSLTHWPSLSQSKTALTRFLGDRNYVGRLDSNKMEETNFRNFPRGLVWVPLSCWSLSGAVRSRNADVMQWVDETLAALRKASGAIPSWLELGSGTQVDVGVTHIEPRPFGNGAARREVSESSSGEPPSSLVRGLDGVVTSKDATHIYCDKEIRTGVLRLDADCSHGRIGIGVYSRNNDGSEERIGSLRPVQRYVLAQGLRRAKGLRESVNGYLNGNLANRAGIKDIAHLGMASDIGYLTVTLAGVGEIAVLPLIVEQIAVCDQEGESPEFILCDGNHRLVQHLLIDKCEAVGCAIVVGEPKQPYYAWPFPRLDWNIVLQNQLGDTPDMYSKYTPRYPDGSTFEDIKGAPDSYRQFFRDFSTGFGNIGSQGGRLI